MTKTLTIKKLPFPSGDKVEVIVRSSKHRKKRGERYPLRGKPIWYIDPFKSVAKEDWGRSEMIVLDTHTSGSGGVGTGHILKVKQSHNSNDLTLYSSVALSLPAISARSATSGNSIGANMDAGLEIAVRL